MIELPAGGLKWKIGQKARIQLPARPFDVVFAPDGCTWNWVFTVTFKSRNVEWEGLKDLHEFGCELEDAGGTVEMIQIQPWLTVGIKVPKTLESLLIL